MPAHKTTSMRIERSADPNQYILVIHLMGMTPQAVKVDIEQGRWISISSGDAVETNRQDIARDGSGYSRSFSYRSNQMSRRLSLPWDADVSAIQRMDESDRVIIRIARKH